MYFQEDDFTSYAQLILHLVSVEENDFVLISADFEHKLLATQLLRYAYKLGACYVHIHLSSTYLDGIRAEHAQENSLRYFPDSIIALFKEYSDKNACIISIRSPEAPEINDTVDASKLSLIYRTRRERLSFFHHCVLTDSFSWIVVAAPTVGWAKTVFPELDASQGITTLWNVMKSILRLDTVDPIQAWSDHQQLILARRKYMNEKHYQGIHLMSDESDVHVRLNPRSTWLGARHKSKNGKYFQANVPTEEIYTSPDCRFTEGHVKIARPVNLFGKVVKNVTMEFKEGRVVDARAQVGNDYLYAYLDATERNRYIGEIALVDIHSLVWKSGYVFNSTLFDENAGIHFALGSAYRSGYGYDADTDMTNEQLIAQGLNVSDADFHEDFVIGSADMSVYGLTEEGKEEPIMVRGEFIEALQGIK